MTAVAGQDVPGTRHALRQRLRAAVLGPRGGGTSRRRASDAFRLGLAAAAVAVFIPIMRANSVVELNIAQALNPPPEPLRWLVTSVFWLGSAGVIALLVIVGLLVPRFAAIRWTALSAVLTWGLCVLLGALLGSAAGLIAGLTSAGIPQDQAVAAVLIQRLCTAYLPPIWGWLTLTWMRRRQYV